MKEIIKNVSHNVNIIHILMKIWVVYVHKKITVKMLIINKEIDYNTYQYQVNNVFNNVIMPHSNIIK